MIARGRAFLRGLHAAGVGGCLKHFPGLGGAGEDTHFRGSEIELGKRGLERDLEPFRALLPLAGAVLISHAIYPALDASGRPATLAPAIATGLLRRGLRFRGVALSDDLEMKALAHLGRPAGGVRRGARRGLRPAAGLPHPGRGAGDRAPAGGVPASRRAAPRRRRACAVIGASWRATGRGARCARWGSSSAASAAWRASWRAR